MCRCWTNIHEDMGVGRILMGHQNSVCCGIANTPQSASSPCQTDKPSIPSEPADSVGACRYVSCVFWLSRGPQFDFTSSDVNHFLRRNRTILAPKSDVHHFGARNGARLTKIWPNGIDQGPSTRCYLANTWPNQASDSSMESQDQELFSDVNFVAKDP